MKTDRFADSIRRKLDSIRPEFTERDWTKMQAMLKQAGPLPNALPARPRVFSGQAARLIAAGTAGTVLFLSTTLYQTYELNRLRNETKAARQQPAVQADSARMVPTDAPMASRTDGSAGFPQTAHPDRQASPSVIRDTVYTDRYIRAPEQAERLTRVTDEAADQRLSVGPNRAPASSGRPVVSDQRLTQSRQPDAESNGAAPVTGSRSQPTRLSGQRVDQLTSADQPNKVTMTPSAADKTASNGDTQPSVADGQSRAADPNSQLQTADAASMRIPRRRDKRGMSSEGPRDDRAGATDSYATTGTGSTGGTNTPPTAQPSAYVAAQDRTADPDLSQSESAGSSAIRAERMQTQPVQMEQVAWEQRLIQRSHRMRPARTVIVGGASVTQSNKAQAISTKPAQQSLPSRVRLRVGPGGDLYGKLWSVGGFAELLVGKHLTVSAGLSRASFDNGTYLDEDDFRRVNNNLKEFRRQYAVPGMSNRHEILDIRLETVRVIMPITVGFRLPISSSIALTPTVGTNLNLKSQEQGSYVVQQRPMIPLFPPFGGSPEIGKKDFCEARPASVFNNITLGANIEWHKKHWGVQAGPVLIITSQPDPDWVSSLSGGIRARAFFQF